MGMLATYPMLSNQAILSYFSRPGRDINHRVIAEIKSGGHQRPGVRPATGIEVDQFIRSALHSPWLSPSVFVGRSIYPPAASWRLMLDWWPVGQGLFSSGALVGEQGPPVNWVYDCGTTSSGALLDGALGAFFRQQDLINASNVRLCVLSHFDRDHVSGIVRLIEGTPVTTLLLPYVPLWRRLVIALAEGVEADDPLFAFYLDPVAFLAGGDREGRIGEIVFVPSSEPEDSPPSEPEDFEGGPSGGEIDLKVERGDPPDEAADDPAATSHAGVQVRFLRPAGRILAPLLWEFVPYNDANLSPSATPAFLAAAAPLLTTLLHDPIDRANALTDLKAVYDHNFGSTSELRNLISLFLYSGPLGRLRSQPGTPGARAAHPSPEHNRCAQIYTGDGTLDAGPRFDAFERFFSGSGRLARAAFFQVMHHGSRRNWHEGIAAKVRPSVSLFSSDPAHKHFGHPHGEVLRDFWGYGAVQIDRKTGYQFDCWLSA